MVSNVENAEMEDLGVAMGPPILRDLHLIFSDLASQAFTGRALVE